MLLFCPKVALSLLCAAGVGEGGDEGGRGGTRSRGEIPATAGACVCAGERENVHEVSGEEKRDNYIIL